MVSFLKDIKFGIINTSMTLFTTLFTMGFMLFDINHIIPVFLITIVTLPNEIHARGIVVLGLTVIIKGILIDFLVVTDLYPGRYWVG
jgi:hypothetical protein